MALAGIIDWIRQLLSVVLIVVVSIAVTQNHGIAVAQSPPQSSGCTSSLTSLSLCLSFLTNNVTTSPPPQGCCSALSSVVKNSSVCLCQLFTANNPLRVPINQTSALALPGACKISTPPLTQCKAADAPAPSPSAGDSSNGAPARTTGVPSPAPSPSSVSPSADSPAGVPPMFGMSPAGEGSEGNGSERFTPSTVISVLAGVILVFGSL